MHGIATSPESRCIESEVGSAPAGTCSKHSECELSHGCLDGAWTPWCRATEDCQPPFTRCQLAFERFAVAGDEIGFCRE